MSTKKSGGKSGSSHGSVGRSGGGSLGSLGKSGGSQGSMGKSAPKPSGGKSGSSHGSVGRSGGGSLGSLGKSGGSQGSMGKSGPKPSSHGMSGGKSSSFVDTNSLRFTQESVKGSFSKGNMSGVKLHDAVADIKAGKLDPSSNGPLHVHKGPKGELWCENNRSLFVARQAGVPSVEVKVKSSDFKSRSLGDTTKEKLSDPNYFPKVRGSGL